MSELTTAIVKAQEAWNRRPDLRPFDFETEERAVRRSRRSVRRERRALKQLAAVERRRHQALKAVTLEDITEALRILREREEKG